jgi:hypothetical protein
MAGGHIGGLAAFERAEDWLEKTEPSYKRMSVWAAFSSRPLRELSKLYAERRRAQGLSPTATRIGRGLFALPIVLILLLILGLVAVNDFGLRRH